MKRKRTSSSNHTASPLPCAPLRAFPPRARPNATQNTFWYRLAKVLQLAGEYSAATVLDLEDTVKQKEDELDGLDAQLEQLEQRGGKSDARLIQEADQAKLKTRELEQQLVQEREASERERAAVDRYKQDLKEQKLRTDEVEIERRKALDDVRELEEQLSSERLKSVTKVSAWRPSSWWPNSFLVMRGNPLLKK